MSPWIAAVASIIGFPPLSPSFIATAVTPLQADPGIWPTIARISVTLNAVLLLALGALWARNYWQFRSKHTLGLFVFSLLLLAENVLVFYYYLADPTLATWFATAGTAVAWRAMMLLHVFEMIALVFLTWVSWD